LSPLAEMPDVNQPLRGVVVLDGARESLLGSAWRRLAALGVRESGF
jgi:putative peptide zinc metalloprotease protein